MSIAASLATQSAIIRANNAEMAPIRASEAQQSLVGRGGDFNSIARRDAQLEMAKEKASTQAKIARTQRDSLKNKNKRNKIDYMA